MLDNSHSTLSEGTDVGIIGGLAVAVWFLILDTIAGRPFQTPSLLGQVVLFGDSTPDTTQIVFGAVLFHSWSESCATVLVAVATGLVLSWALHRTRAGSIRRFSLTGKQGAMAAAARKAGRPSGVRCGRRNVERELTALGA
jgi:hypothetical protein